MKNLLFEISLFYHSTMDSVKESIASFRGKINIPPRKPLNPPHGYLDSIDPLILKHTPKYRTGANTPSESYDPSKPLNVVPRANPCGGSYKDYLASGVWHNIRARVLSRDEFECMKCGSRIDLQVHHRTYRYVYNEEACLLSLETLCKFCHNDMDHVEILKTWPDDLYGKLTPSSQLT